MARYELRRNFVLTLYVRAGFDGKKYGACPMCQRVFMVLMLKASECRELKFRVATVPKSGLPDEFRDHGLRNLPAIIHGNEAIDTVEEIIEYIDSAYPEPTVAGVDLNVDKLTRNFFAKFCYYIKAVAKDAAGLRSELERLDDFLKYRHEGRKFISGDHLTQLDCEILPKLHHLRVAGKALKGFEIPAKFTGIWGYLNSAYNDEFFVKTCPPDQEIILHWSDRPDTPGLSYEAHSLLTKASLSSRYSFDVPAIATPVTISV